MKFRRLRAAAIGVTAFSGTVVVGHVVGDVAEAWPTNCEYRVFHSRATGYMCWDGDRSDAYALRQGTTCGTKYGNVARVDSDGSNVSWGSGCSRTSYYVLKWENY